MLLETFHSSPLRGASHQLIAKVICCLPFDASQVTQWQWSVANSMKALLFNISIIACLMTKRMKAQFLILSHYSWLKCTVDCETFVCVFTLWPRLAFMLIVQKRVQLTYFSSRRSLARGKCLGNRLTVVNGNAFLTHSPACKRWQTIDSLTLEHPCAASLCIYVDQCVVQVIVISMALRTWLCICEDSYINSNDHDHLTWYCSRPPFLC